MDLNWLQSILYGFLSGFMDIVPVSAQAHKVLLLKFYGAKGPMDLQDLLIHAAILSALYFCNRSHIIRISRARALARVPKNRRRRPLDTHSLMDFSMIKTMLIPVVLGVFLYQYTKGWAGNLVILAVFLFVNGLILYIPQFLPSSNRDSRTLSRVEGLLMGLGGTVCILPGISAVGASVSVGSVCGTERSYGFNMALMMNMFVTAGLIVYDIMGISANGAGTISFVILVRYLLTAIIAFGSTVLAVKLMRHLAANHSFSLFAFYCFGLALFTFLLNLMA